MRSLKLEGGNAVTASKINQENVADTLKSINKVLLPKLNLKPNQVRSLGSTGKKNPGEQSGDIDLAIDTKAIVANNKWNVKDKKDVVELIEKIVKRVSKDVNASPGFGIVSLAFPIANTDGKQKGESVQLDLMLTDNLDYTSFAFHSPRSSESKYKGYYRNFLLSAISKVNMKVLKKDADGKPLKWERLIFDLNKGLTRGVQSREGKKGPVKNHKTISSEMVSSDPNEIIKTLFGPSFSIKDLNSYESTMKAINSPKFKFKNKRKEIFDHFKNIVDGADLPMPANMQESRNLNEGITHMDDLDVSVFMDTARKMVNLDQNLEVSVKFDGNANLGIGLDDRGKLFFDRAVKGQSEKLRGPDDYPAKFVYNALRAAMAAIVSKKAMFEKLMKPGDWTDVEVMFEAIPNSIEYGKNIIVFHDAAFTSLVNKIKKVSGNIDLYFYDKKTKKIERQDREVEFILKGKEVIDTSKYKLSIAGDLDRLEKFLSEKNGNFKDLSNLEVLGLKSVGQWKDRIKKEKESLTKKIKTMQVAIKDKLIDDLLSKIPASDVAPPPVFDEEGNNIGGSWPEGIVMKDLQTGQLSKIVSIFPQVNEFLWKYRKMTGQGAGAAGEYKSGIGTNLKYRIAEKVFGIKALKTGSFMSKIKNDYKGKPTNSKILNYLKDNGYDFKRVNTSQAEYVKAVKAAKNELKKLTQEFENNKGEVLKIRKGKFRRDIKYDDVHITRTYENLISTGEQLDAYQKELQQIKAKTNEGKAVQLFRVFLGQRNLVKINENKRLVNRKKINEELDGKKGKKVGVLVGRMQPPTVAHFELVKRSIRKNDVTYVFLAGQKLSKDNPVPHKVRAEILKFLRGAVIVKPAKTGYMPGLIEEFVRLDGVSQITIYAGTDRISGYKRMFQKDWSHDDIAVKIEEMKRDPDQKLGHVSGTAVRKSIIDGDLAVFNSMMAQEIPDKQKEKLFKILQKFIKA